MIPNFTEMCDANVIYNIKSSLNINKLDLKNITSYYADNINISY